MQIDPLIYLSISFESIKIKCADEDLDVTEMFLPLSHRLEVRAQVAEAFLAKFQLSNEEMATLRGARDAPITEVITHTVHYLFTTLLCSLFPANS